ncbi:hsp70 family protein [Gigaspora margarita]|uniref:Hsp70 family protein n=1 Tax=Gigaspora margarita TaxID=4874 RepID=A0A8H3XFU4_GIGMA|nr:hsp70 family protein [Gigaspora margarita]
MIIKSAIKILQRREKDDEITFKPKSRMTLKKFTSLVKNIKEFAENITNLDSPIIYENTNSIKNKYAEIIKECKTCMKNMNNMKFPITIDIEDQRRIDDEGLKEIEHFITERNNFLVDELNSGLIIYKQDSHYLKKSAYKFKAQPTLKKANRKFHIKLVFPVTKGEYFLLDKRIDPSVFNPELVDWISRFLTNNPIKAYLEIRYPEFELSLEDIKLPRILLKHFENALKTSDPYHELIKLFEIYGFVIPIKFTYGHKLYRLMDLSTISSSENIKQMKLIKYEDFDTFEVTKIFDKWDNLAQQINEQSHLYFKDNNLYQRNEFREWANFCIQNKFFKDLQINYDKLCPLYDFPEFPSQQEVKSILGIGAGVKEKVLASGIIKIRSFEENENEIKIHVDLRDLNLKTDNYHIFGRLISHDGKPIDSINIIFKCMCNTSFYVKVAKVNKIDRSKYSRLKIAWMLIGLPEIGYYSLNTRKISVLALESYKFHYNGETSLSKTFQIPKNILKNSIICTSFKYPPNCWPNFIANIANIQHNENEIKVTIRRNKDPSENNDNNNSISNEYILTLCILHSENNEITADPSVRTSAEEIEIFDLNLIGHIIQYKKDYGDEVFNKYWSMLLS